MIISNVTPPQVWAASARSLTNFGSGALAPASSILTSLAANTSVDFRTSAGIVGSTTIAVQTGAGATAAINIELWDGTSLLTVVATAAAATSNAAFHMNNTASVGPRAQNTDATHAGFYMHSTVLLTI